MTPRPPAPAARPAGADQLAGQQRTGEQHAPEQPWGEQPWGEQLGELRLRLPAPGCTECMRVARTALEVLEGVLVVEALPGGGEIAVTYDARRVNPAALHSAGHQAGCTST